MDALLGSKSLPPGFRFHPTDEELFMFYLKRKVMGKSLGPQMMSEVDVFQFAPWELPARACLKTRDLNWYFLCPRSKKYPNGGRANRATVHGYWKSTGNDRTVNYKNRPVGKIKTLIFHRGKPPKGDRTDWVMHEYRLEDKALLEQGVPQDSYVLCKLYEKSGLGPKNGENYGAPFIEEEWDTDNDENLESDCGLVLHPIPEGCGTLNTQGLNGGIITSSHAGHNSAGPSTPSTVREPTFAAFEALPPIDTEEDELDRLLAKFIECDSIQAPPENDVFVGLDDLPGGNVTSEVDIDWSRPEDWFLELKDLQD
ncbi:NAC domain-containing protein 82-like [Silene latifolia]|uniref:NAC domain-containing protein 82-like n=1 Tax=Silene latifolia TaxID=37657 RepID=UPI003D76C707